MQRLIWLTSIVTGLLGLILAGAVTRILGLCQERKAPASLTMDWWEA